VFEEMVPQGSLGQAVKSIAWESGASCRIDCLSLKHEFIHVYGSHADLLAAHGLNVSAIERAVGN
jgi:deoxyxylulose-5-phosphate synthase